MPLRLALGSRPMLPGMTLASSEMMSPKRLLVTTTPLRAVGFLTMIMAALSMSWCSTSRSGNSRANVSFMTARQRRLVASTLALSSDQTFLSPRPRARKPARRATRSTSARE